MYLVERQLIHCPFLGGFKRDLTVEYVMLIPHPEDSVRLYLFPYFFELP